MIFNIDLDYVKIILIKFFEFSKIVSCFTMRSIIIWYFQHLSHPFIIMIIKQYDNVKNLIRTKSH